MHSTTIKKTMIRNVQLTDRARYSEITSILTTCYFQLKAHLFAWMVNIMTLQQHRDNK